MLKAFNRFYEIARILMRLRRIGCLLVSLTLLSCASIKYVAVNEFGTEKITLHKKKNTFGYERRTSQRTYQNEGHYTLGSTEITLQFKDSIVDARFLPNFSIERNQFQPRPAPEGQTTIVLLDKTNVQPIQMQTITVYDSDWNLIAREESNFNGEIFLLDEIKNQRVTIYCSYFNPIQIFISDQGQQKHIVPLEVVGTFEMDRTEDVINVNGMKYVFEVPSHEKFPAYFGSEELNKKYEKK